MFDLAMATTGTELAKRLAVAAIVAAPNPGQLALLGVAVLCFALQGMLSVYRVGAGQRPPSGNFDWGRVPPNHAGYVGILATIALIAWHAGARGQWTPLDDNFEALLWLGLLVAAFAIYIQGAKPLGGLDWFYAPIVVLLLIGAGYFGSLRPQVYGDTAWSVVHRISAFGGAAAFAVACAGGAVYLLASRRLRQKVLVADMAIGLSTAPRLASLERLERVIDASVTLGFALLSVALLTGVIKLLHKGADTELGPHWLQSPKIWLSFSVWLVYALVLHTPISPSIRGRKAAMLSILGFVLMVGTLVATQFMPGGSR
jgi:ABC-type transport system involved in cytochrome c biogenesis permease subunit